MIMLAFRNISLTNFAFFINKFFRLFRHSDCQVFTVSPTIAKILLVTALISPQIV